MLCICNSYRKKLAVIFTVILIIIIIIIIIVTNNKNTKSPKDTSWNSKLDGYTFNYDKLMFGSYTIKNNQMYVNYPKKSYASDTSKKKKGGCGFYGNPNNVFPTDEVTLQYQVYFDPKFDFVLGGKLPGINGGSIGSNGGNLLENGFSVRLMWRVNGTGELYLYVPKNQAINYHTVTTIRDNYGDSLGYNNFTFTKGEWNKIKIYLKLNDIGFNNGIIKLWFNNTQVINYKELNYRNEDILFDYFFFNTFFGGNTPEYASKLDTYSKFKDFVLEVK